MAADQPRAQVEAARQPRGSLILGSPQEVADKILLQHSWFGHDRTMIQLGVGTLPHSQVLAAIERLGREVAPLVRAGLAARQDVTDPEKASEVVPAHS